MCFSGSEPPGGMDAGAGPTDAGTPIAGCPLPPGHILVTARYQFGPDQPVLSNVEVELRGPSGGLAVTNASGQARFNDLPPGGGYEVLIDNRCTTRASQSTSVTSDQTTPVTLVVQPRGTLQGKVTDATNPRTGIAGATVTVVGPETQTATADASGVYSIGGLLTGSYQVTATKPGFTTHALARAANFRPCGTETIDLQIQQIFLEIVDRRTGTVISGTTVQKMVGNKIQLGLQTRPAGRAIASPHWTVPGTRVKNYTQSTTAGVKTDISAADLQARTVDYFWIDGGSLSVQAAAQVAGAALTATATFNVQRPTVDHFAAVTSSVNLCVGTYLQPGTWQAAYSPSTAGGTVGCQWDARVTVPAIGGGNVAFTQRIRANRVFTNNANIARTWSSVVFVLDEGAGIQYSGPQTVAHSASVTLNSRSYSDSPAIPLNVTDRDARSSESFELNLMYRSSEADSIWVTLSMLTWQWAGQSMRIGAPASVINNWNAPTSPSLSATASSRSTTLPEWSTNYGALGWH